MSESSDILSKFLTETPEEVETVTMRLEEWMATVHFRAQLIVMIDEARALLRDAKCNAAKTQVTPTAWLRMRSQWAEKADPLIGAVKKDIKEGKKA